jgi:DNA-binding MarR family transcriptional regulator
MSQSPWLSEAQQTVWRSWLTVSALLPAELHRQLAADSGLSLPDFDVLVQLSEATEGRLRVSQLSAALGWERSRVSHHVTRMSARGLVAKEKCGEDGRGAFVAITGPGRASIERAAPGHARTVKELVFADLGEDELAELTRILRGVAQRVLSRAGSVPPV